MKKFINDPEAVVDEMLQGFLDVHAGQVRSLDRARVVVRSSMVPGKVGIVTGGGSGHKPAFAGYVGEGFLDAAVVGDIFTSPTAMAVLEAIRATDTGAGVMLLMGNYSGDVMNFSMAADLARAEGHQIELAVSTDDVGAGFRGEPSKRRGVVGSMLIWKACGAVAARGAPLADVKRIAEDVNASCRTMGVAIGPCTVPAVGRSTFTLAEDELELGVGHHGERGVRAIKLPPVDEVVDLLLGEIIPDLPYGSGDEVVTLINGLGATPLLELYIAQRRLRAALDSQGVAIHRSYVGEFFTALEMAGFSVTLLRVDEELKGLIDAPASTPHFVQC